MDSVNIRIENCRQDNYQHLDLSNLNLDKMPELPQDILDQIHFCGLSENNLVELVCPDFKKLKILDISHNSIHSITNLPKSLEELVCPRNCLSKLDNISSCTNLERIDCTDNHIVSIPECRKLKILYIAHNKLNKIPSINSLEKLICHNNQIDVFDTCPNLIYLDARNNKIQQIKNCSKLKQLYINNNNVCLLENLYSLEYLECIHNLLDKIPYFENVFEILCDYFHDKKPVNISKKYKENVDYIQQYNHQFCCIKMKKNLNE